MSARAPSLSSTTDRRLPLLARAIREPANGLTHLAGVLLAVIACVALVWVGIRSDNPLALIGLSIFGVSQIGLYTASTLYHSLRVSPAIEQRLLKFDLVMVYVFIAGSYTPLCLVALHGAWRWTMLGIVWGLVASGLVFLTFWMHAPTWLSTTFYVLIGWVGLVMAPTLFHALPRGGGRLDAGGRRGLHRRRARLPLRVADDQAGHLRCARPLASLRYRRQRLLLLADDPLRRPARLISTDLSGRA